MKKILSAVAVVALGLLLTAASMQPARTDMVPPGAVMAFATAACPSGWVAADGTPRSKTVTYAALCTALGATWGAGDASNCATPDFKTAGRYLRAANATNPVGSLLAQGTVWNNMTAALTSGTVSGTVGGSDGGHTHTVSGNWSSGATGAYNSSSGGTSSGSVSLWTGGIANNSAGAGHGHGFSLSVGTAVSRSSSDAETRPVSAAVTYCIKY